MITQTWSVALYDGARDNRAHAAQWGTRALLRRLCWPQVWTKSKIDIPAWSPIQIEDGARRAAKNVQAVSMLVLDCDAGESIECLERLGDEYVRLGHASWSHRPEHPKARLIFPFARPCSVEHWPRVWSAAARWASDNGVTVDAATKDPSRLYFLPYVPWQAGDPGGNVHLERFESWAYESDPDNRLQPPGGLPGRHRRLLDWAHLASDYPEPAPRSQVQIVTAGRADETTDDHGRRRRQFALAMLRHRCRAMIAAGEGGKGAQTGRNNRTFALARLVARLTLAGCIDQQEGISMVESAAGSAGLSPKEYGRAIRNGLSAGVADGPEDVDRMLTEDR